MRRTITHRLLTLAAALLLPALALAQAQAPAASPTQAAASSAPTQAGLLDRIATARGLLAAGVAQNAVGSALAQGWTSALNRIQSDAGKNGLTDQQLKVLSFRLDRLVRRIQAAAKTS